MSDKKKESDLKKIVQIFKNFGLDTGSMSEEEVERIYKNYKIQADSDLNQDFESSKKYYDDYGEEII